MNSLREHYERVLLVAAVALLLASSIFICRDAMHLGSQLSVTPAGPTLKNASPMAKAEELDKAIEKLHQPLQWTMRGRSGLFVPEKHFIGANGFPAALQTDEVHPPVPNEWLEKFGLPIADADVLEQDPDNDGFSNLDEWTGHTNPTDADSHPEYYTKLKLKSAIEEPFNLVFSSWVDDTYAINTTDLKQPTQFVKIGDPVKGTHFKVAKFVEKYQPNKYGTNVDVSELTLEQEDKHQSLTLVKERIAISPESVATLVYTWRGQQEFQARKDQQFALKPLEHLKYKLIEIEPARAVIVDLRQSDEPIEIGLSNQ